MTSGYCNCRICCGVWSGGPTASGAYPTANHTIAVDASNPFVPIGTKVVINGVEYTVEDTGAFARYGVQFDVYYDNHAAASAHGHQTWEAEKYLGVPYVWGGYSPSGFDCSGFVSYVINHCGNGWNYGRLTADGLRGVCTYVSPQEAKPGDLIFFQGTYNTSGASHVGIYVGNNMMIHCGDPIHYSNISTSYWQQHFMCFGRLP